MAYARTSLSWFEISNDFYASAVVAFYLTDANDVPTAVLATLYSDKTTNTQLPNPITLDGTGKSAVPMWVQDVVVASITLGDGSSTTTGAYTPNLSLADVNAAAASAVAASNSAMTAQNQVVLCQAQVVLAAAQASAAAASAAAAAANVGSVLIDANDSTPAKLASKLVATLAGGIKFTVLNSPGNESMTAALDINSLATLVGSVDQANDKIPMFDFSSGTVVATAPSGLVDEGQLALIAGVYGV